MIKGGVGGSRTQTGLVFENETDISKFFVNNSNYRVEWTTNNQWQELFYKGKKVGLILKKHKLYNYLKALNIDWQKFLSKKLLPDNAIYDIYKNTLNIIEIKFQKVAGSVDEKLQTCDFKKKQYQKLVAPLNWNVEYIYVLNNWFKKPEYKDTLDYVINNGCRYYFNDIPRDKLGLGPLKVVKKFK